MRNIISLIIGFIALILVVVAFIPLLGWANWVIVPLAVVGLAIGATSPSKAGRNLIGGTGSAASSGLMSTKSA